MRRPSAASLKKVTPENLAKLGAERLADILLDVASSRPELKRRLRMELAAEQGPEHLSVEIDKRMVTLQGSKGKISWRQRPAFVRDFDVLRSLIADRLSTLDAKAAQGRLWAMMALFRRVAGRMRDRDGEMEAVFQRAAEDLGRLVDAESSVAFVEAAADDPSAWSEWAPFLLKTAPDDFAAATLPLALAARTGRIGWSQVIRVLADRAGDPDAFQSTFTPEALRTPQISAEVAQRFLAAGRVDEAGRALEAGRAPPAGSWLAGRPRPPQIDFDWESAWIEYLDQSGQVQAAQDMRWASFERTLSADRARAFTKRLTGFDDVEAEGRAFAIAAKAKDFETGLAFLMDWPALSEAARMIVARKDEIMISDENTELWAGKLRVRQPAAALLLLRKAAAQAFRRRDLATSERLTQEADSIDQ